MELGKYKHYKGSLGEVIGIVNHSETVEQMVLYKKIEAHNGYPAGTLWVRPLKMFFEQVLVDGKEMPRFAKINE
ncbi:MAG: DUF1653 domain-containing protein [Candidatus Magasanikbacteria bacterium CG10_big_fil_rev_8_21_14_0_10_38_6]|uniref:DUF1653 domain-containing protein n=1 Tax=Candidatus Magasanikbacteria bacterium CG10_big_fil_rev_8_21_14_0_10_38_6 TaxID=1974647 RepID=A0A2M6P1X6_9BACT|nr:MAG: DUF1653 domain-containing protein [Candidatus Magasanikbacteria bacterium CG10_big_fil_rev_8_21_14_0_10_38_6]